MHVIARTIVAMRASTSALMADWIRRCQKELSDAVHLAGDICGCDHGWQIARSTGRLGFGTCTYRDPRFGNLRRVLVEATLRGAEWIMNAGAHPRSIEDLIVGNQARDRQAARKAGSEMAVPEATNPVELGAIAQLLTSDMREELLVLLREIFERNAPAERLAYSPEEAADLLGISR